MNTINIPDHILFEDDVLLVLHKPAGLMVEPDRNNHPNLLQQGLNYIRKSSGKGGEVYLQHIHRLDRPVSGIILFAKQKAVLRNLSEQFAERKVKKSYQAITSLPPASLTGQLENWIRTEKKKAVIYENAIEYSERAILNYRVAVRSQTRFLWDIELHTGKYHQIRAQLSHIGCPIDGDQLYGSVVSYQPNAIALNACRLTFAHPLTGQEMMFEHYDL